jgi:hypothetical protein
VAEWHQARTVAADEPEVARSIGLHEPVPEGWRAMTTDSASLGRLSFRRFPPLYLTPRTLILLDLAREHRRGIPVLSGPVVSWPARLVYALRAAVADLDAAERRERAA